MKKRILGVAFGAALVFGSFGLFTQNADAQEIAIEDISGSSFGCVNKPDINNGDCTFASSKNGKTKTYFCENSIIFHDCVKG